VNLSTRKENLHEAGMQFNMKRHATTESISCRSGWIFFPKWSKQQRDRFF
jgi:hypothetical protein